MKIFIVNLYKDKQRREHILQQCHDLNLEAEVISAVDGRALTPDQIKSLTHPLYASGLTTGEIGCALSHHSIYKKMVTERIDYALVLEDDVGLTSSLPEVLKWYESTRSKSAEVILLSETNKYIRNPCDVINNHHKVVKVIDATFAHAYLLNLKAAEKLAEFLFPIWLEADRWTLLREYALINLKAVIPPVGVHAEISQISSIWVSEEEIRKRKEVENNRSRTVKLIKKHRPLSVKLRNTFWRLFVRKFLAIEQGRPQ